MPKLKIILAAFALLLGVGVAMEGLKSIAPPERANFTGVDLNGKPFSLADVRGKHLVILTFFATWCGPCRQELPEFARMAGEYKEKGLQLVVVTTDPPEAIRSDPYLSRMPATWIPDAADVHRKYGINSLPHTMLFAPSGEQIYEIDGYSPDAVRQIEGLVRSH